ncbi:hypothetical protein Ciccas_014180 [Cichlidogyrus casuarinus]|uniref:Uncharacterized protein n=1 Tax=Cichlidogyrus casuarinus TaxID=1844966 RepID=A0ABD2PIR5_9PLAT
MQRKNLSIESKLNLINDHEQGSSLKSLQDNYGISYPTLKRIISQKQELLAFRATGGDTSQSRLEKKVKIAPAAKKRPAQNLTLAMRRDIISAHDAERLYQILARRDEILAVLEDGINPERRMVHVNLEYPDMEEQVTRLHNLLNESGRREK